MKEIFENDETEAVILVDASNAFNSLNRMASLHNIRILCPQFSTILINTYRISVRMIILGGKDILSSEGTTQGDNLAMSFYALGITVLINHLRAAMKNVKNVCLADDITGAGSIVNLLYWWSKIVSEGAKFGYFVKEKKSWLITKSEKLLLESKETFSDYDIKFTLEGQRHLGAAIGSEDFRTTYATEKVNGWCNEMTKLTEFAKSQPHAAYAAFCHGEVHKYTYFMRTISGMQEYLKPLDNIISNKFIPTLLQSIVNDEERKLYSLPVKNGGLGIPILSEIAESHYENSKTISAPLAAIIVMQGTQLPNDKVVNELKRTKKKEGEERIKEKIKQIDEIIPPETKKAVDDARQPGTSSWLSAIPLEEYGFCLNKGEFRDAVQLRYGKELKGLPSQCPCGQKFDTTHALNCKKGGFVTIRHNNVRDYEASLLCKLHSDVEVEPSLQPIEGEIVNGIAGDNARPDVRARGIWRDGQNAFLVVRITNTNALSQRHISTEKILSKHEKEKKREYNKRIMYVEHGTFTPLVFSVSGVMAKECSMYHKHIAEKISRKYDERYEKVINIIRCKLSFIILKSALLCVRGSRSYKKFIDIDEFSLAFDSAGL